jgi:hypothetical protein
MADRQFHPAQGNLEIGVVCLFGKASIGATGAVSSFSGKGFASMERTGAGAYKLTLSDSYNKVLFYESAIQGVPGATEGASSYIVNDDVDGSDPHLDVAFVDATDGSAADPADGSSVFFKVTLRNSSVD